MIVKRHYKKNVFPINEFSLKSKKFKDVSYYFQEQVLTLKNFTFHYHFKIIKFWKGFRIMSLHFIFVFDAISKSGSSYKCFISYENSIMEVPLSLALKIIDKTIKTIIENDNFDNEEKANLEKLISKAFARFRMNMPFIAISLGRESE
ncbi:MAG: hypothetical protein ABIL78_07825 [candidate division WOR-3 bacterium]